MSEENKDLGDSTNENSNDSGKDFSENAKETANEFTDGLKNVGGDNKKVLAGILAIFFGSFGIHKFILGYQKEGIILLVITVVGWVTACIGIGFFILSATSIIGIIEGIIYLTKSDEEFENTYQVGQKPWF